VVIVFPAQIGIEEDYDELSEAILRSTGMKTYVTPLTRLDWPLGLIPSFFSKEYLEGTLTPRTLSFYFQKVDIAVSKALAENPETEFLLLGHSIGGWIARAWLSEWAQKDVKSRVKKLVTLGSPHNPPRADSSASAVDQTRGLLKYINENYPGNFEKNVQYVSVIGSGVTGRLAVTFSKVVESFETLLAYFSYSVLSGDSAEQAGDGMYMLRFIY
jgi:pimeloyl-ACP methyl ester carboxylesterase